MFFIFTYSSLLFLFFRDAPVAWFQNRKYLKTGVQTHQLADQPKKEVSLLNQFNERNTSVMIMSIGAFCALVSYIIYINLILSQKILQRVLRINSALQIHAFSLAVVALLLYVVTEVQISFDGLNSSNFIQREMPTKFH